VTFQTFPFLIWNTWRIWYLSINFSTSCVQDKLTKNGEEFQLDEHINEPGFLRIKVYSRFGNDTRHQTFSYRNVDVNCMNDVDDAAVLISGYYCTCQSEARTVGTCAHIAILWFLSYARHKYDTLDANRQVNLDIEVIDNLKKRLWIKWHAITDFITIALIQFS